MTKVNNLKLRVQPSRAAVETNLRSATFSVEQKAGKGTRILMTGGSGLLGSAIRRLDASVIAPSRKELEVTSLSSVERALDHYKPTVMLHLAAATNPPVHEKNPVPGLTTNIIGTATVALSCFKRGIKLVYTSTDYLYIGPGPHREDEPVKPPSKFAYSKLGGECAVSLIPNSLILRLSFGPVPFPWEKVYADQWNSKLYVDEMAPLVLAATRSSAVGILNLGGPRISLEDYARRTRPDIETIPRPEWVPHDTSLDIAKMRTTLSIENPFTLVVHHVAKKKTRHAKRKRKR